MATIQETEAKIMRRVIKDALAAGYCLSVNDGEEFTVRLSLSATEVFNALRTTDEDHLYMYAVNLAGVTEFKGRVYFVYGNDGYDVICDHSTSLTDLLKGASDYAESLAD